MANIYVRSTDGNDADDGSTWALAKATLTGALAIATSADTIFVSQAHAESTAATVNLTFPGTPGCRVLCVNDAAEPPTALATTATVTTTGVNRLNLVSGYAYIYGITFNGATGGVAPALQVMSSNSAAIHLVCERCDFVSPTNNANNTINLCAASASGVSVRLLELIDCRFKFAHASQGLTTSSPGNIIMRAGPAAATVGPLLVAGGTVPNTLFLASAYKNVQMAGLDLSDFASKNLFAAPSATQGLFAALRDCKLGSSVTLVTGTWGGPQSGYVRLHNCDSADTNYRFAESSYMGDVVQETIIVRSSGASDGTTPLSWKLASSANTRLWAALASPDIVFWNDTVGASKTVTIEIVNDGTTLQDDEIWVEVEALTTSGFPLAGAASDRMADVLATPANQASSAVAWTTTGLASPTKQKLEVTFTPQEKGLFRARVMLAEPSKTVYVDPLLAVA
ncbi:MAG TPA: hypothetical protein VEC14_10430 [Reyranellaceae bacterium]|nr:hypothetical protein [Reyranellaceae bacterium]